MSNEKPEILVIICSLGGFLMGVLISAAFHDPRPEPVPTINDLRANWTARCIDKGTGVGMTPTKDIINTCSETAMKIITPVRLPDSIPGSVEPAPAVTAISGAKP